MKTKTQDIGVRIQTAPLLLKSIQGNQLQKVGDNNTSNNSNSQGSHGDADQCRLCKPNISCGKLGKREDQNTDNRFVESPNASVSATGANPSKTKLEQQQPSACHGTMVSDEGEERSKLAVQSSRIRGVPAEREGHERVQGTHQTNHQP